MKFFNKTAKQKGNLKHFYKKKIQTKMKRHIFLKMDPQQKIFQFMKRSKLL